MNYLAIEYNQRCMEDVVIKDNDGNVLFKNYLDMTYDEMKASEDLEKFVLAVVEAASKDIDKDNNQIIVTLIGNDDIFIWSIIIGTVDGGTDIRYVLVDWKKDGKSYRYGPEITP